jgi:hypothetical protein
MILSINKYYKNIMYLYNRHQNNIIKNIQMILVKLKFKKLIKEINHWKIRFIKQQVIIYIIFRIKILCI